MIRNYTLVLLVFAFSVTPQQRYAYSATSDVANVQAFATKYCIDCHSGDDPEGELSLDRLAQSQWNDDHVLNRLLTVIERREMPPKDALQPANSERNAIEMELSGRLDTLVATQTPGVLKRLNRTEYQNTINDLLQTKFEIRGQLPVDNTVAGFNNTGEKLFISPFALDTYYRVASQIVEEVVGPRPEPTVAEYTWDNLGVTKLFHNYTLSADRALMLAIDAHAARIMIDVQRAGYYRVSIDGYYHQGALRYGRGGDRAAKRETGVRVPREFQRLKFVVRPTANTRVTLAEGEFNLQDGYRVYLRPGDMTAVSSYSYAFPLPDLAKLTPEERSKVERPADKSQFVQRTMFCLASAKVSGPYYDSWPPQSPFYDAYFAGVTEDEGFDTCRTIIRNLAPKVFRRPVSEETLAGYYEIAEKEYKAGRNVFCGVQSALKAMLCSPDFLFKYEGDGNTLDDYAVASRMSYFLWNSLPDDRLFVLAAAGKLQEPEVRRAETLRMLQDPRADRFVQDFVGQWLELHKLDDITPMPERYDEKQFARVKPYLKQEPLMFFKEVLANNLSLLNFIDSDFVVINSYLNDIYKLPRVSGTAFRRIKVEDSARGGLLSQPAILLMTTSNGEFTNPFYRGAWVARNLYGEDLEPPADAVVSALKPPTSSANIRENINLHRQEKQCNSCHRKLDSFGLALENFDVVGRWRDTYTKVVTTTKRVEIKTKPGEQPKYKEVTEHSLVPTLPVESSTEHADGREIAGPAGLKILLMEDKDRIARNFVEKLFTYAMGRENGYRDRRQIESSMDGLKANEYRLRDLIVELVASDAFVAR